MEIMKSPDISAGAADLVKARDDLDREPVVTRKKEDERRG